MEEKFDITKTGSIFITGPAGSGKSYLINSLKDENRIRIAFTSATGISASNIGGQTIHRFAGIGTYQNKANLCHIILGDHWKNIREPIKKADLVIIDEISMIRADVLDLIDSVFKAAMVSKEPFGGKKMLFSGDFMQLSPVVKSYEKVEFPWAFQSDSWKALNPKVICLSKVYRQTDMEFLKSLHKIRFGIVDKETCDLFESRNNKDCPDKYAPRLMPLNAMVDQHNYEKLKECKGSVYTFEAELKVVSKPAWRKMAPDYVDRMKIEVKDGARVIMTKNDKTMRYVNGSLGYITGFNGSNDPIVSLDTGDVFSVQKEELTIKDADGKTIAMITQYPIRLGWALTIHRAQGATLDCALVDMKNIFTNGQAYVAFSRVRKLEDLYIKNWDRNLIGADEDCINYYLSVMQ